MSDETPGAFVIDTAKILASHAAKIGKAVADLTAEEKTRALQEAAIEALNERGLGLNGEPDVD